MGSPETPAAESTFETELARAKESKLEGMKDALKLQGKAKLPDGFGDVPADETEDSRAERLGKLTSVVNGAVGETMMNLKKTGAFDTKNAEELALSSAREVLEDFFGDLDTLGNGMQQLEGLTKLFRDLIERVGYEFRQEVIRKELQSRIDANKSRTDEVKSDEPRQKPRGGSGGKGSKRK